MGMLSDIDLNDIEPSDFEPLQPGWYVCCIEQSEKKPTSKGNGHYLQLDMTVAAGPRKGKRLWERLNLWNPNQTAVNIAKASLKKLAAAVDIESLQDPSEMHFKYFEAKIVLREYQGENREEIKDYRPCGSAGEEASKEEPMAPAVKPSGGDAPWS